MTATLPPPLTPPECDLRDFPRMMIDIPRLRASAFDATPDDAAWRAGFNLWISGFHSVPAASLDDDDSTLCKAAGLGRDLRTWRKVKATAMRGWVLCSDGRWYHQTVAEVVLEAWLTKLRQRLSSGAGNAKRWGKVFDAAQVMEALATATAMLAALCPTSAALGRPLSSQHPGGTEKQSNRDKQSVPPGSQGKGKGREDKEDSLREPVGFDGFFAVFPRQEQRGPAAKAYAAALARGATVDEMLDGARRCAAHHACQKTAPGYIPLAKTWLADSCWRDKYPGDELAAEELPVDPSWGEDRAHAWSTALGDINFKTYFGPAEFIDADPPILRYRSVTLRRLAADKFPKQLKALCHGEVVLEVAA